MVFIGPFLGFHVSFRECTASCTGLGASVEGFSTYGNLGCSFFLLQRQQLEVHKNWGNIGIMENQMETTIVYWGFIGIMEKKMEATIVSWDVSTLPEYYTSTLSNVAGPSIADATDAV